MFVWTLNFKKALMLCVFEPPNALNLTPSHRGPRRYRRSRSRYRLSAWRFSRAPPPPPLEASLTPVSSIPPRRLASGSAAAARVTFNTSLKAMHPFFCFCYGLYRAARSTIISAGAISTVGAPVATRLPDTHAGYSSTRLPQEDLGKPSFGYGAGYGAGYAPVSHYCFQWWLAERGHGVRTLFVRTFVRRFGTVRADEMTDTEVLCLGGQTLLLNKLDTSRRVELRWGQLRPRARILPCEHLLSFRVPARAVTI